MKKALALLLAAMMLVATLTACGGGGETQSPAAPSEPTGSAPAEPNGGDAIDAMTFKFSSTYQEAETGGQIIQFFIDKVSELSGGAITVDISWGGTLFDAMGELDAVMDGAVQMIALGHMPHLNTLNYLLNLHFISVEPSQCFSTGSTQFSTILWGVLFPNMQNRLT